MTTNMMMVKTSEVRELMEQRKDLLAALKGMVSVNEPAREDSPSRPIYNMALAAIARVESQLS